MVYECEQPQMVYEFEQPHQYYPQVPTTLNTTTNLTYSTPYSSLSYPYSSSSSEVNDYRLPQNYKFNPTFPPPPPFHPEIYKEMVDTLYNTHSTAIQYISNLHNITIHQREHAVLMTSLETDTFMPSLYFGLRKNTHVNQPIYQQIAATMLNMEYIEHRSLHWKQNPFNHLCTYYYIEDALYDVISSYVDRICMRF